MLSELEEERRRKRRKGSGDLRPDEKRRERDVASRSTVAEESAVVVDCGELGMRDEEAVMLAVLLPGVPRMWTPAPLLWLLL